MTIMLAPKRGAGAATNLRGVDPAHKSGPSSKRLRLEALVDAGPSPIEALRTATLNPLRSLGAQPITEASRWVVRAISSSLERTRAPNGSQISQPCRHRRMSRTDHPRRESMLRTALLVLPLLLTGNTVAGAQAVGHRVKVNGMQMYYEVSGRGDPLIVLHGAYMNIPMLAAIVPKLAASHTVYALEFQGHGRTTDINRPITYQNLADDVSAFMDAVGLRKADVFGYSMGAIAGLQLAIRHPAKLGKLVFGAGAYDFEGWKPEFRASIPKQTVEMMVRTPFAAEYKKLAPNPNGFPELARKIIALQQEPMAWAADVKGIRSPVLIIAGDADGVTLEHAVAMFHLLGGGAMGDMGKPLPASRLAILPATSHTSVITQADVLHAFIEPFLKGSTPKGMFAK
jgi:pimeloyl-ACP methyl ester carboxylesterase